MRQPRLFVTDRYALGVECLTSLLEDEFEVVATATDGRTALEEIEETEPDLALLDLGLPKISGIEVTRRLSSSVKGLKILVVAEHRSDACVCPALKAGAKGYILKRSSSAELRGALHQLAAGGTYVTPLITKNSGLTFRQESVLSLIAIGKTGKQVGECLSISLKTVEYHKAAIQRKLSLVGAAAFTRYAIENGIDPQSYLSYEQYGFVARKAAN